MVLVKLLSKINIKRLKYKGLNNWSQNIYVKLTHIFCRQLTVYPIDATHFGGMVVGHLNTDHPNHRTAITWNFSSDNTW